MPHAESNHPIFTVSPERLKHIQQPSLQSPQESEVIFTRPKFTDLPRSETFSAPTGQSSFLEVRPNCSQVASLSIFRLVQPSCLGFPVGVSLHDLPSLPHRSECPTLNPNTPGWGLVLASVFPVSASCLLTEDASLPSELRGRFGLWMSHLS